ncbi:MAG: radical SAM protein [Candidatus Sigynarchaeota archaeon]
MFFGHYLQGEIAHHPPLALAYLAAVVREKGHCVSIIDAAAERLTLQHLSNRIEEFHPDVIGITTNIGIYDKSIHTARHLKLHFSRIPIIMGGPWATMEYKTILKRGIADVVVIGEGEKTIVELMEKFQDRASWASIQGIAFLDQNGHVEKTKPRELITDLEALPFPAWDLFPSNKKYKFPHRRFPFYPVMTSRGCPFDCIHCTKIVHGYKFRARPPENIIAEIQYLKEKHQAREVLIIDDVFNLDISRAKQIMARIIASNLDITISFTNGIRADRLDEDLVSKFKNAGVYSVALGIESGCQEIVDKIGKKLDLQKVEIAVRLLKKYNIVTMGFFILGHPYDTYNTMIQTLVFAKHLDLDYPHFFKAIPFPGSQMYEMIKKEGKFHNSQGAKDTYIVKAFPFDIWKLRAKDAEKAFNLSYRLFYLRPRKILQLITRARSRYELAWLFRAFINIIVRNLI